MGLPRRLAWSVLVLALLGTNLSPCPEAPVRAPAPGSHAHAGPASPVHGESREALPSHPPGCQEARTVALGAPCPCGCEDREPASPAGPLGDALLASLPGLELQPPARPQRAELTDVRDAPLRHDDPVPRAA